MIVSVDSDSMGTKKPFTGQTKSKSTNPLLWVFFLDLRLEAWLWLLLDAGMIIYFKMPFYFEKSSLFPPSAVLRAKPVFRISFLRDAGFARRTAEGRRAKLERFTSKKIPHPTAE